MKINLLKIYSYAMALGGIISCIAPSPAKAADFPDHLLPESATIYFQRVDQLIFIPNLLQTPVNRRLARSPFSPDFHKLSLLIPNYNSRFSFFYSSTKAKTFSDFYGNNFSPSANLFFSPGESRRLGISGDYQLGRFYVSSEFTWDLTETDKPGKNLDKNITFKFDAGGNYGNLQTGFMYYFASADDGTFNPLNVQDSPAFILNNSYGVMQAEMGETGKRIKEEGLHAFVFHSDLALTNRLNIHGGLAYGVSADDLKNSYGMEVDLGASYAIFDNLIYEIRLGYLNVGNVKQYEDSSNPEDMYLLTHHLTLEF